MRVWKLLGPGVNPAIGGEEWQRGGVIDRGLDAVGAEMRRQRVAARMLDRIEVKDVAAISRDRRRHDIFDLVEAAS